jgi:hypothetical protein
MQNMEVLTVEMDNAPGQSLVDHEAELLRQVHKAKHLFRHIGLAVSIGSWRRPDVGNRGAVG